MISTGRFPDVSQQQPFPAWWMPGGGSSPFTQPPIAPPPTGPSPHFILQHLRGRYAVMPSLADGEIGLATDLKQLFVGYQGTNYPIGTLPTTAALDTLTNGSFVSNFRSKLQGPSFANGSYCTDCWVALGESSATDIQYTQVDESANNLPMHYSGKIANANAGSKHTGLMHILTGTASVALRGQTVTLQCVAKTSTTGRNMRAALIEWTGAIDAPNFGGTVHRDPVLNWASTSYMPGGFFRSTSIVIDAVSPSVTPNATYTALPVTGTVSNACNNLIVMVWEESATPTLATWNIAQAALCPVPFPITWQPKSDAKEIADCKYRSEVIGSGDVTNEWLALGQINSTTQALMFIPYTVAKRAIPTIVLAAAGAYGVLDAGGSLQTCTSTSTTSVATTSCRLTLGYGADGTMVAGQNAPCITVTTAGMILIDADI